MEGQNQFDSLASVFEIDFGTILGRFGSQDGTENRFMGFFFECFLWARFWHRFLVEFGKVETLKIDVTF